MTKRCSFVKDDDSQCKAFALTGKEQCFQHDPSVAKERTQARSRGGKVTGDASRHEKRVALIGDLVEKVEGVVVADGGNHRLRIETLDDLQLFAEHQIDQIEDKADKTWLSAKDQKELRLWAEFMLKLLIVRGLDAHTRLRRMEQAMDDVDMEHRKQLAAPGG